MSWFRRLFGQRNDQDVNDPKSQRDIGNKYYYGEGVAQDYNEAVKWFRLAADQGDAVAQCSLGAMYETGDGVPKDHSEAIRLFSLAAQQGQREALTRLRVAANQGNSDAQYYLGYMYETGTGIIRNYCDAHKWFRLAAAKGNIDAQYYLGYMYENGHGVLKEDYIEAAKWYRLAAKRRHSDAITNLKELERELTARDKSPQKPKKSNVKEKVSISCDPALQYLGDNTDPRTQFEIGNKYYYGQAVAQDYKEALKWFSLAAQQGYSEALAWFHQLAADKGDSDIQFQLGLMYETGKGVSQSYSEAIRLFSLAAQQGQSDALTRLRVAANQGNSDAQYNVGQLYETGQIVSQSYSEAIRWYRLAANQGHVEAINCCRVAANKGNVYVQNDLGLIYAQGKVVKEDYIEAAKWFRLAADKGNSDAQFQLGLMYENGKGVGKDYSEALNWYRLAAQQGHSEAQYNLGVICRQGNGVNQDFAEAIKWFQLDAKQGNSNAQFQLGLIYETGEGVSKDYSEALKWYRLAAKQGHSEALKWFILAADKGNSDAQYNLGLMYANGQGVNKNYREALRWCRLAAKQGHCASAEWLRSVAQRYANQGDSDAQFQLGLMYETGKGVPRNYCDAFKWFRLAAQQGNNDAEYKLGYMYENGLGVFKKGYAEASKWYRLAADKGHPDAITKLQELDLKLTPGDTMPQKPNKSNVKEDVSMPCDPTLQYLGDKTYRENQFNIGNNYYYGDSVAQDYNEAVKWYRLAADKGHPDAITKLQELDLKLTPGDTMPQKFKWRIPKRGPIVFVRPENPVLQKSNKSGSKQKVSKPPSPKPTHLDAKSSNTKLNGIVKELNKLIGLERVKKEIYQLMQVVRIRETRAKEGLKVDAMSLHSVFLGSPGTGKTTVARLYGQILRGLGLLSKGHLVETDRSGLVAGYIGQTEIKTDAKIKEALGGILFIDEAYSLSKGEDNQNDFGNEAISILLKRMEDHRDDLVVIVAGYDNPMEKFLRSNEGLKSRFSRHIHFDDFSADELVEIFQLSCSKGGYEIGSEALDLTRTLVSKAYGQRDESFGNARYVRNLFEDIVRNQNVRLAESAKNPSHKDLVTILPDDIPKGPQLSSESLDELLAQLKKLIGLEQVKDEIDQLTHFVKIQQMRREQGLSDDPLSLHCVFFGNPGTGKTTVARIYGKLLNALGLLSKGHVVETDRSGLVAGYIGQTEGKTDEKVREALGGILFIDEAYSLSKGEDSQNDFGNEAISILLKRMEDHRDDLVVIVAGYDRPMEELLESNEGLKSRFSTHIHFPDYSPKELLKIFELFCKDNHYQVQTAALKLVQHILENEYQNRDETFGNGRLVRNLFESVKKNQAVRISKTLKTPSDNDLCAILPDDIHPLINGPVKTTKIKQTKIRTVK